MITQQHKHTPPTDDMCVMHREVPHICKGKDIRISFPVERNGQAVDLSSVDLRLTLRDETGMLTVMPFTAKDNVVSFVFEGIKHRRLGYYSLRIWENFGKKNQCMLDMNDLFALVPTTDDEYYPEKSQPKINGDEPTEQTEPTEPTDLQPSSDALIETEISGTTVSLGITNISLADAKSAYDSAVEYGYDGSEEEFGETLAALGQCYELE